MTTTAEQPQGVLRSQPGGSWGKSRPYPTHQGSEAVLRETLKYLGVSQYRMALLLGVRPNNIGQWFNGRHRPGPRQLSKLLLLQVAKGNGLPVALVDRVDWETDTIHYQKGVTLGENGRQPLADFLHGAG